MARKRRPSKNKKINPTYFVFCEGKTEVSYVNYLKTEYRIPSIHIDTQKKGNNISTKYIQAYKKDKPTHEKDLNFLMYDLDVPKMRDRLSAIQDCVLLVSNPSIELWFLLHYKNQKSSITSIACCREMKNRNKVYKKGLLDDKLREKLATNVLKAVKRAKDLNEYGNPSSSIFRLIDILENLRK